MCIANIERYENFSITCICDSIECILKLRQENAPEIIFSDEDPALITALELILPEETRGTKHFLCDWHISKNVRKHVQGVAQHKTEQIIDLFSKARDSYSLEEFEVRWNSLLTEVCEWPHLVNYFKNMLPMKSRWARYFRIGEPFLNIFSTQRVESINSRIGSCCNATTDVNRLITTLKNIRIATEHLSESKMQSINTVNQLKTFGSNIFEKCIEVNKLCLSRYASSAICEEMGKSVMYRCDLESVSEASVVFKVYFDKRFSGTSSSADSAHEFHIVNINRSYGSHTCCPCDQNSVGIVCRHYFAAMFNSSDYNLPYNPHMVSSRWRVDNDISQQESVYIKPNVENEK